MKIFKIAQATVEGQCHAMRCKEAIAGTWMYISGGMVELCARHARDLEKYKAGNPGWEAPAPVPAQGELAAPEPVALAESSLENILVSNLAVKTGYVEAREKTAKYAMGLALTMNITDIDTRDKADQLLGLVHIEEKAIKAEQNAMYKPVKDAAKATKTRLDSWFGPTLGFYAEAKDALKEKIGTFIRAEKAKEDIALDSGDHEAAAKCATEAPENVRLKRVNTYAIQNEGVNLPVQFLVPDDSKNAEIVALLPRNLLIPNYDLLDALVKEHGKQLEIPDVTIITTDNVQMKGRRSSK